MLWEQQFESARDVRTGAGVKKRLQFITSIEDIGYIMSQT
jgi:hypothetical protein